MSVLVAYIALVISVAVACGMWYQYRKLESKIDVLRSELRSLQTLVGVPICVKGLLKLLEAYRQFAHLHGNHVEIRHYVDGIEDMDHGNSIIFALGKINDSMVEITTCYDLRSLIVMSVDYIRHDLLKVFGKKEIANIETVPYDPTKGWPKVRIHLM